MITLSGITKCAAVSCALSILPLASFAHNYVQTNLVSDIPQPANADGTMVTIDPHLKNPWGWPEVHQPHGGPTMRERVRRLCTRAAAPWYR